MNKIEKTAQEFIDLKQEKARIEKCLEELKETLEPYLLDQVGNSCEMIGWKFSLTEQERENFSLSKAREKIDGRTLAPFITTSKFTQIRTIFKGQTDKKAA